MTLSSNIGNHAILSSDIYLGVSSMNQMINQNQFLTENSYTKLKNDHDLKVPFTGYAYSNPVIFLSARFYKVTITFHIIATTSCTQFFINSENFLLYRHIK